MTRRFSLLLGVMAVIALLGAGCAKDTATNTTTNSGEITNSDTSSLTASVSILASSYSPKTLTVKKGTTVTWTSTGGLHTVTGDNGGPNGENVSPGNPYSFTFDTVGIFPYHCVPHGFIGTVTVTD